MIGAYYHHDIISYAVHAVVWDLVRETVHALTRGVSGVTLAVIAVAVIGAVFLFGRRRA